MFWTRLASSVVLVLIMVGLFIAGALPTGIAVMVISMIGIFELLRVFRLEKSAFAAAAYLANLSYYLLLFFDCKEYILFTIVVYLLVVLSIYVFSFPRYADKDMLGAFLAFIYVGVMLSYIYQILALPSGLVLVFLIFVSSWVNDVFAYCVGRLLGKHKLAPKLSPKKSVEGFIGGIVGAALFGMLFGYFFNRLVEPLDYAVVIFAVIGGISAFPAVIGDLAASAIKRNHDIKDYGKLIPGHGGVLDRFDSVIFTAPIVYYLLTLFGLV